ncbi:DUF1707 SHOCT-like domain-containing protein [Micromonospora radicis]|uniref:DUF1707 domain-containing protein n=1 Tax=Micromonospora radicis TaxID=1894971 RepID=A0A418MVT3_9ACTN|nr:DUF1707 domain-containing protein [Micromonospora radicis]
MRAADSDRQATAERLRVALDEGRLDLHEYDERLRRTYAARTYAELDDLVEDLPPAGAVVPAAATVPGQRSDAGSAPAVSAAGRGVTARWLVEVWEPWLKTVGIVTAIWAATSLAAGDALYFWPGWVAGPWGAVVLVRTVTGLATGEPQRWAADQERRRQRRAEKKALKRERKALRAEQTDDGGASGVTPGPQVGGATDVTPGPQNLGGAPTGAAENGDGPGPGEQRHRPGRDGIA